MRLAQPAAASPAGGTPGNPPAGSRCGSARGHPKRAEMRYRLGWRRAHKAPHRRLRITRHRALAPQPALPRGWLRSASDALWVPPSPHARRRGADQTVVDRDPRPAFEDTPGMRRFRHGASLT